MTDDRDRGVEFGGLNEDLESESYPLGKAELLDRYGDRELEHAGGTVTVREVLVEEGDRQFRSADEVHEVLLEMVGAGAVGRRGYSDRGAGTAERADDEAESF